METSHIKETKGMGTAGHGRILSAPLMGGTGIGRASAGLTDPALGKLAKSGMGARWRQPPRLATTSS